MITFNADADAFTRAMTAFLDEVESSVASEVKAVVTYIDNRVHERTPVYTGQAARNMIWSTGSPHASELPAIESPADTGYTSTMPLGGEPRREANQKAAQETLHALDFKNPFQAFYLSNNSPDIELIEDGEAGLPGASRAPNGVFAITVADVLARLKAGAPLR